MDNMNVWIGIILAIIAGTSLIKICYQLYNRRHDDTDSYSISATRTNGNMEMQIESQTEFGPVNYYANDRHNRKDKWFQFKYKKVRDEWLTYILRMPSLNGRDGNLHITHRYRNGNVYWICYEPQPKTLKDAQVISRVWADRELEYISTGTHFEDQKW